MLVVVLMLPGGVGVANAAGDIVFAIHAVCVLCAAVVATVVAVL